jgi:hypothetical protein
VGAGERSNLSRCFSAQPPVLHLHFSGPTKGARPLPPLTFAGHNRGGATDFAPRKSVLQGGAHDWIVGALGPLFRTAGHTVRTQYGVTASAGQRRGDVEIRSYLRDQAGSRSLVFDLSIAHDRFGSSSHVQQNGLLSHPQDLDGPLRVAAQRAATSSGPSRS